MRLIPFLHCRLLPRADITILSSWETSSLVEGTAGHVGLLAQIVFDFELYETGDEVLRREIRRSLSRSDVRHIAGSDVAADMLRDFGVQIVGVVNCGVDTATYAPGKERIPNSVLFPLRRHPSKGARDAVAVARILHDRDPSIVFQSFGDLAPELSWIDHRGVISDVELVKLYQSVSVFLLPSLAEGWGLTAVEALACGAAVVSTRNGGVEQFLVHGENALLASAGDVDELANAVYSLLADWELRKILIRSGMATVGQMSWDTSSAALLALLRSLAH